MIIWINGTFGAGKTTAASLLQERLANSRVFDPEHVGYMLSANFADVDFSDFQQLPPWRQLVPHALKSVQDFTNSKVIAPQTVLDESYWAELYDAMGELGLDVRHVLLDCTEPALRARIDGDEEMGPSEWRHDHVPRYVQARSWLAASADLVIDTTEMTPDEVVEAMVDGLKLG